MKYFGPIGSLYDVTVISLIHTQGATRPGTSVRRIEAAKMALSILAVFFFASQASRDGKQATMWTIL